MHFEGDKIGLPAWRPPPAAQIVLSRRQKNMRRRHASPVFEVDDPIVSMALQGARRATTRRRSAPDFDAACKTASSRIRRERAEGE